MSTQSPNPSNPAYLSDVLRSLFPAAVVVAELRKPGDLKLLLPAEAEYLGRAIEKRRREFVGGRLCARRAMAEFGLSDFPLRVAADRQPVWPEFLVGSITHTAGLCAAAVADRRYVAAIGLDSEVVGHVVPELWNTICHAAESAWLYSLPVAEQAAAASMIFSAKEAFYKCQYPLSCEWLDFHDLRVEATRWSLVQGAFAVQSTRSLKISEHADFPVEGQYRFHDEYVSAGVALLSAAP